MCYYFVHFQMVSTKFYNDYDETEVFINNWAYEGDISMERLKQLEISFLNAIQWNLLVSDNEFHEKLKTVERLLAQKEGLARNYFTYTELEMLMPTIDIAKQIIHYATVIMFTYACSILTIALSSIILTSIPLPVSKEISTPATNITTDSNVPEALPKHVMISINELYNNYNLTECTFDDDSLLDPYTADDAQPYCNFTIDFPFFNQFQPESSTTENFQYFRLFQKHNSVPLFW